jgi:MFS family permease
LQLGEFCYTTGQEQGTRAKRPAADPSQRRPQPFLHLLSGQGLGMSFQPASSLKSRTYIGLIVAQFFAAFNDQAIHASAMFFAIRKGFLSQAIAISLMPILFYAPWAIFCTLSGYLADKYSKRNSLVFWKVAEVGITLTALVGFWIGGDQHQSWWGPFLVLSTVALMGTHSAFFVPAKYGSMPEILQPHLLSRANGILESTSFLAIILGTTTGGVLSEILGGTEIYIGVILVGLALIGAGASLLIQRMPAANPSRPFPINLYKPLFLNLRSMVRSRPLLLAMLGIAFFTFLVAFMRSTVYMHGESQSPHWHESQTSLVVGTTAIGVSLGGLLAGFFSGGKIELGLVPLGAVGMIICTSVAAYFLNDLPILVVCIILIGFFAGFYTLPLFTLLQHRAPKTSKGDSIATSNFINVIGAMLASGLFAFLVYSAHLVRPEKELKPVPIKFEFEAKDLNNLGLEEFRGELMDIDYSEHGRPNYFEVLGKDPRNPKRELQAIFKTPKSPHPVPYDDPNDNIDQKRIMVDSDLFDLVGFGLKTRNRDGEGSQVVVSSYALHGDTHLLVKAEGNTRRIFDDASVPRFLFIGASLMTLCVLLLLWRLLPDFFLRSWVWLHSLGRYRLQVVGVNHMPTDGPAVLAMSCGDVEGSLHVLSVTDRTTHFFVLDRTPAKRLSAIGRSLARGTGLTLPLPDPAKTAEWEARVAWASGFLKKGQFLALPVGEERMEMLEEQFLRQVETRHPAVILPVFHSQANLARGAAKSKGAVPVQVVIGEPLPAGTPFTVIRAELKKLADWSVQKFTGEGAPATTLMIPRALDASPTAPAADLPARPS